MHLFSLIYLFLLQALFLQSFAAGPVTHGVIAERFIQKYALCYSDKDKADFMLGTLYPDIRYLVGLPRSATHEYTVTLNDILQEKNPFTAGKRFHSWVDETRHWFIKGHYGKSFYEHFAAVPPFHRSSFIKFLEDELLFNEGSWSTILRYLEMINPQEIEGVVSYPRAQEWHALLAQHFTYRPTVLFSQLSAQHQSYGTIPLEIVRTWAQDLPHFTQDTFTQDHVQALLRYFEHSLMLLK